MAIQRFRAPGRVNLMGDHTDYNDGFVLPMAIDRECVVAVEEAGGARIRLRSATEGDVDVAADGSDDLQAVEPEWGRYPVALARVLAARGRAAVGIDATVSSTVPIGAGLSSSAALQVVLALALCAAADLPLAPRELALACQEAEHRATGVPCGIMDQLTSVAGVAGAALLIDCRSLAVQTVPLPDDVAVVVVHSGVPRLLAATAFAARRQSCEAAARRLGVPALRDASAAEVNDDPLARHVVAENARVLETAAALRDGDVTEAGRLFHESHASLRDDFGVSTPELDRLVTELELAGAFGARLTGAGFGGAVVALCSDGSADAVAADVVRAYRRACGREATAFRCRAVAGAGPAAAA